MGNHHKSGVKRRSLAQGVAWTVPVILLSAAAPAYAASHCQDAAGASFADLEKWSISIPASGSLVNPQENGVKVIAGQEYWVSEATALGDEKAQIILETSFQAGLDSEHELRPGCRYSLRYEVAALETELSKRKGDVKLEVRLYSPRGIQVRNSGHVYTTKPGQDTDKTTSVPLGKQVPAPRVRFTAHEGTYRIRITITVAAEENRHVKVAARGIGITSPYFEFDG